MSFRSNLERMAEIYGGIAIFSVDKGSTTHRAGVRAGDVLVAVNGRRVRRLADYASARKLQQELLELVVVRDGRELKLWTGHVAPPPAKVENDNATRLPDAPVTSDNLTCPWRGAA
jgi:predicted metalloprotease with PDZ domain